MVMNLSNDTNKRVLSDSPALPQPCDAIIIIIITVIIIIEAAEFIIL